MFKKYFYILFLYINCSFGINSVNNDSLFNLIQNYRNEKNQHKKAGISLSIANKLNYSNIDKVLYYAHNAYEIGEKINNYQIQVEAIQLISNASILNGNYKIAEKYLLKSKDIFENNLQSDKKGLVKTLGTLGVVSSEQSNYKKALEYYLSAKQIAIKNKLFDLEIILNNNIGVIYKSNKQYKKALKILDETQKLQLIRKDVNRGITLTNKAAIYIQINDFKNAKKELDQAFTILKKSNDFRALGEWYNNNGLFHVKMKQFVEAENDWLQALFYFSKIDDQFGSFDSYYNLSDLYLIQNNNNKALKYAQYASEKAYNINILEHKSKVEKLLSIIYEKDNNYKKALIHSKTFQILNDSLMNVENIREMTRMEMDYKYEGEKLKNQKKLDNARNKQWIIAMVMLMLFLIFCWFYLYKKKQLSENQLKLENQLLDYKQKALHLQMNPHFVFNCLAAISSYILQNEKEEAVKYLAMFSKLMRFTLESSKENWITIDKEIASLNQYLKLEQLRLNNIFDFQIEKKGEIEDDMLLPPMLIQPLVENSIIHGILPKKEKGNIKIIFSIVNENYVIKVLDNGIGIENSKEIKKDQVKLHKSLALSIIKERLEMLKKTTNQNTKINFNQLEKGTEVEIELPIKYAS